MKTQGFDPQVEWEPFIDGPLVGYKCTRLSDGARWCVYFNPSTSGEGSPDVFVYTATTGMRPDPCNDSAQYFMTPEFDL